MLVEVKHNNVGQALRTLKKKLKQEGIFYELQRQEFYETPSERKARKKREAKRRARKRARDRVNAEQRQSYAPHHAPGANYLRKHGGTQ